MRIHGGSDALGPLRYDFSSNSNACGPCPAVLQALREADASRYPEPGYAELRAVLAQFHAVAPWRIVLAGSASEFIFRVTAWARRNGATRVWLPCVAYGDYAHAASAWQLQASADIDSADLVWACEPSSPLGQAHTVWPGRWPAAGAGSGPCAAGRQLVLDCAYVPLRLRGAASLRAEQLDAVWQLWSPNKALGLTGVRAAYAIAPLHAVQATAQLEALAPSWVLGAHGVALLQAWTHGATQDWIQRSRRTLARWRAALQARLTALGWSCLPSDSHFFCARPPAALDLAGTLAHLRQQGIKLRDTSSMGLNGHVRLSAQPPAYQRALQRALEQSLEQPPVKSRVPFVPPAPAP